MGKLSNYFGQNIDQKRIVITGGTTGIGRATAELLASLGGHVFIFGRDIDDFDHAYESIKATAKGNVFGITADIAYADDVEMIWKEIDKTLGGVDILINNAAVPADGIMEEDRENIKYIVDTNIVGYMSFAKEAASRMKEEKSGHIINIGSMSAETREETGTVYVATKSAIRGFTAALRKEINEYGIKVSLIEPGAVTSDMQPAPKQEQREKVEKLEMLEAEDIAASIVFCLSQPKRCDIVSMQVRPHLQII
nr:SDR family oxidoreductase [uncultured Flavobacterium sp.]